MCLGQGRKKTGAKFSKDDNGDHDNCQCVRTLRDGGSKGGGAGGVSGDAKHLAARAPVHLCPGQVSFRTRALMLRFFLKLNTATFLRVYARRESMFSYVYARRESMFSYDHARRRKHTPTHANTHQHMHPQVDRMLASSPASGASAARQLASGAAPPSGRAHAQGGGAADCVGAPAWAACAKGVVAANVAANAVVADASGQEGGDCEGGDCVENALFAGADGEIRQGVVRRLEELANLRRRFRLAQVWAFCASSSSLLCLSSLPPFCASLARATPAGSRFAYHAQGIAWSSFAYHAQYPYDAQYAYLHPVLATTAAADATSSHARAEARTYDKLTTKYVTRSHATSSQQHMR